MTGVDAIGWTSSFILLLTIGHQVLKQWKERSSQGVSKWLFLGQVAASIGFVVYSALLENWVFVVTNALLLVAAVFGLVTARRQGSPVRTAPVSAHRSASTASIS
jgi:MtN3 and saliva related transmembrane protein